MKILVIQQKKIGDVLFSTVLLEALRKKYPDAKLHYLVNSPSLPVLYNNPYIDELVVFTQAIQNNISKYHSFLNKIKKEKYDIVIDAYVKISSGLMTFFSKAETRIAYHKDYKDFIYNKSVQRINTPLHDHSLAIENRLRLLEPLGIPFAPTYPKIYLSNEEIDSAKTSLLNCFINLDKPLVMVSVLGSLPQKTYPFEYMAKLLDYCVAIQPEIQFLFNYLPHQKEKAEAIYRQTEEQTQQQIALNIFGKGLREFLALTAHCDALIGNEGGANNMAKALDIPTFTIFSPYLPKHNWFGKVETEKHTAVHLTDFIDVDEEHFFKKAKQNPSEYYKKLKPEYLKNALTSFIKRSIPS